MTMPHLMNCAHSADGWCLDCVRKQHAELELLRAQVASLSREAYDWSKALEAQIAATPAQQAEPKRELLQRSVDGATPDEGNLTASLRAVAADALASSSTVGGAVEVPNTFKLPGESDDAWLNRITGAAPVALSPTISLKWDHDGQGGYFVEMRVNSIRSESQAHAAMAYIERLFCGGEINVN